MIVHEKYEVVILCSSIEFQTKLTSYSSVPLFILMLNLKYTARHKSVSLTEP